MIVAIITVPTLALALPLMFVAFLGWMWAWQDWVMPRFRAFVIERAVRHLQAKTGLSRAAAEERVAEWEREGWPG